MASRARQFSNITHAGTTGVTRAMQFATITHARVTSLSSPIRAFQNSVVVHARIIPIERVLEVGPPVIMSFPYGSNNRGE